MEMQATQKLNKPATVKLAVFLMYAVVAVAVSVFLIYQISKGHNWARWTLMVILAVAIPLGVLPTIDSIEHSPLHAQLGFAQLGAFIFAALLLLMPPSSKWLKSKESAPRDLQ
jgi:hypothetical protein